MGRRRPNSFRNEPHDHRSSSWNVLWTEQTSVFGKHKKFDEKRFQTMNSQPGSCLAARPMRGLLRRCGHPCAPSRSAAVIAGFSCRSPHFVLRQDPLFGVGVPPCPLQVANQDCRHAIVLQLPFLMITCRCPLGLRGRSRAAGLNSGAAKNGRHAGNW